MFFTWLLYLIPALAIEIFCFFTAPLVACFIVTEPRRDVVKRQDKKIVNMDRDYLHPWLRYWQTHDNAVDEWWYGVYNVKFFFKFVQEWTQDDYDNSKAIRWFCRVCWLWRNCAYGFHYAWFSKPFEATPQKTYTYGSEDAGWWYQLDLYKYSFQLQFHIPILFTGRYQSNNIGWKSHTGMPKVLYANRILLAGFRKNK